jgi:hypothetical protein
MVIAHIGRAYRRGQPVIRHRGLRAGCQRDYSRIKKNSSMFFMVNFQAMEVTRRGAAFFDLRPE